jgi:hypothetical protein
MRQVWLVTNPASGSVTEATRGAVAAALERHARIVGRTGFPAEPLPDADQLDTAGADTLVVLAGDGTINAAACKYASWTGALLILPGGTMNLLARALHQSTDAPAIVEAAAQGYGTVALPYVSAAGHCAYVGLIIGPATSWNRAREQLRAGHLRALARSIARAWRWTMARRIRLEGVPGRAQAVFVTPHDDALAVDAIEAADARAILQLGWGWVTGAWMDARAVTSVRRASVRVLGRRAVGALVDGEPHTLAPGTEIGVGRSREMFLATNPRIETSEDA